MTDTQTIKDRLDIVELIGEYVRLKKAGTNWKAPCPFHHEKTPSFMVHPERQIWHCFGCGKGGDVFSFIQEIEGLEFIEALKLLAQRAGVTLERNFVQEANQSQRNRLLEINAQAAQLFHHILVSLPAAERARQYLSERGLSSSTMNDWQIGYAPDQWDLVTKYLLKKGHGIDDAVAAGLTIKRDGANEQTGRGYYDRFRGRIMFPISDPHGSVVGFTGRIIVPTEQSGGKYVNTPQTILYDKSRIVYGLDKAKTEIKNQNQAILVEGQMDVISCHQAGMKNVVAASGTALTPEQVKLLKRYTTNVAMAFDADTAGQKAGERAISVALAEGLGVRVIVIPPGAGKDADECLRHNPARWFKAVKEAEEVITWYFSKTFSVYQPTDAKQKQIIASILLPQIVSIPHGVEREDWLKRLSDRLGIDVAILRTEAQKINHREPGRNQGADPAAPISVKIISSEEMLMNELWSLVCKFPEKYGVIHTELNHALFGGTTFSDLYEQAENLYNTSHQLNIEELRQLYVHESSENFIDLFVLHPYKGGKELSANDAEHEMKEIIHRLNGAAQKEQRRRIQQALTEAEYKGDKIAINELLKSLELL